MSGTKKNCSVEILQKALKKNWPDYLVIGNQPQFTKTVILRKEKDNSFTPVQEYNNNYEALQAIITQGWSPEKGIPKNPTLIPELGEVSLDRKAAKIRYTKKLVELLSSAQELGKLLGIDVSEQQKDAIKIYKKLMLD